MENIPVILITSEATKDNIQKAVKYKFLSNFIKKPYEKDVIFKRLGLILDMPSLNLNSSELQDDTINKMNNYNRRSSIHILSKNEIFETNNYISKLGSTFRTYLKNNNLNDKKYIRISSVMNIMLNEYSSISKDPQLDKAHIEILSQAAYFYDIGIMTIPINIIKNNNRSASDNEIYRSHTISGANIIQLNSSLACRYFVHRCRDICMYHHELFSGGNDYNDIFPQMIAVIIEFDSLIIERPEISEYQYNFVMKEIEKNLVQISTTLIICL